MSAAWILPKYSACSSSPALTIVEVPNKTIDFYVLVVPEDWERSWIVSVYKGKGDALECGSYRGIKLLDQVMKVMERVIEKRIRSPSSAR